MTKQIITIKSITQKTSKAGKPFWTVETTNGKKLSVWDSDISDQLLEGDTVEVEALQKDMYTNIVQFNKVLKSNKEFPVQQSSYDISYAKDILVAMIEKNPVGYDIEACAKVCANCIKNIKEILNGNIAEEPKEVEEEAWE